MSKWYGKVGYVIHEQTSPGVYVERKIVREYGGDAVKVSSSWQNSQYVNDNITLNLNISIIADEFAEQNFAHIKYVEYMGSKWKVKSAEPQRPRIILTIGGVYK